MIAIAYLGQHRVQPVERPLGDRHDGGLEGGRVEVALSSAPLPASPQHPWRDTRPSLVCRCNKLDKLVRSELLSVFREFEISCTERPACQDGNRYGTSMPAYLKLVDFLVAQHARPEDAIGSSEDADYLVF